MTLYFKISIFPTTGFILYVYGRRGIRIIISCGVTLKGRTRGVAPNSSCQSCRRLVKRHCNVYFLFFCFALSLTFFPWPRFLLRWYVHRSHNRDTYRQIVLTFIFWHFSVQILGWLSLWSWNKYSFVCWGKAKKRRKIREHEMAHTKLRTILECIGFESAVGSL